MAHFTSIFRPLRKPRRLAPCPMVESLESRCLLAAEQFAVFGDYSAGAAGLAGSNLVSNLEAGNLAAHRPRPLYVGVQCCLFSSFAVFVGRHARLDGGYAMAIQDLGCRRRVVRA